MDDKRPAASFNPAEMGGIIGHVPLVEYRCSGCGSLFEKLVPRTEGADSAECPVCRAPRGQRVISLFASVRGGDGASTAGAAAGGCCGGGACGCGSG